MTLDTTVLGGRGWSVLGTVAIRSLCSCDASSVIHAIESSSKTSVADTKLVFNLFVAKTPLEHEGTHTETLTGTSKSVDHLLDIIVAEELAPASTHATHGALAFVLEVSAKHLVKKLEVCLGDTELLAKLGDDI